MSKINYLVIFFFLITNCSFDNKSGIWTGSDQVKKNNKNTTQNTEFIFKKQNKLIEEIELTPGQSIKIDNLKTYTEWNQRYQNQFNNINNVSFLNNGNSGPLKGIIGV